MNKLFRIIIDCLMLILYIIEMGEKYVGNAVHEWLGVALMIVFIIHNILNRKWYKTIFKGKYNSLKILNVFINIVLIICMLGLFMSGIMISMTVFKFLGLNGGALARQLHIAFSYLGLIFIGLHLGLHIGTMFIAIKKKIGFNSKEEKIVNILGYILSISIIIYGIYIFIKNNAIDKILGKEMFEFVDETKTFQHFFEITIMIISFSLIGYFIRKLIIKRLNKRKEVI